MLSLIKSAHGVPLCVFLLSSVDAPCEPVLPRFLISNLIALLQQRRKRVCHADFRQCIPLQLVDAPKQELTALWHEYTEAMAACLCMVRSGGGGPAAEGAVGAEAAARGDSSTASRLV